MNALVETYEIFKQLILQEELNLLTGLRCAITGRSSVTATLDTLPR